MEVPGSAPWHASFMGFTQPTDWDFDSGGVIFFDDGTIWSYEAESPVYGDQHVYEWPQYWIAISEWKPSTNVWERLTPNSWGSAEYAYPPGHTDWPCNWFQDASEHGYGSFLDSLTTGPIGVANIGAGSHGWTHVQDGDDVWFYPWDNLDPLGPIRVDRHTRTWTRYMTNATSEFVWGRIWSNVVLWGEYMWFITRPNVTCADEAVSLARAEKANPDNVVIMHTWTYGSGWDNIVTSNLDLPSWFVRDNHLRRDFHSLAIDDDGYAYLSTAGPVKAVDSRTTPRAADGSGRNHNMSWHCLMGFKIGDYDLEPLYWHANQGWIGYDAIGSSEYGSYYWGGTGIETAPGEFNLDYGAEPTGMGYLPWGGVAPVIRDGWLYWVDASGHNGGAYGTSHLLCRMDLSKLQPETPTSPNVPIQHNAQDPLFEVIGNGTNPWEGNAGHSVRYGPFNFWRDGGTPILPFPDSTINFDGDGNIVYKCMMFPPYYSAGGVRRLPPQYGVRGLLKLSKPEEDTVDVTITFTGTSLTGYGNIREVPTSQPELIVRLGHGTEDPDV